MTPPAERGGSQCPVSVVVTIVVFFSFSEQLIILFCERKAGSYDFHHFLADKGSLNSIIQTEQINNKNTLTISCYHCKFSILNLPDTLSRNLGSTFCFLILVLQYLCGQTKTAMLIQTERFHRKNG